MKPSKWIRIVYLCAAGAGLTACSGRAQEPAGVGPPADVVFLGDHIVTMDPDRPSVEAVAVRGETIAAAGSREDVLALRGETTRVVELGDRALLPGFIDAHGHFLAVGRALDALSLHPPPVGDVRNIDDVVRKIRAWIAERDIPPGGLVLGGGYDDSLLAERRHPTRDDLDRVSVEHRIVLTHVSGHLRTANSAELAASGVTAATPDPPGGHIRRRDDSLEPDGVLEERAGGLVAAGLFAAAAQDTDELARRAIGEYVRYGTTTVQDGSTGWETAAALRTAAEREPFAADVAAFPRFRTMADAERVVHEPEYRGGFRIAGVKFSLDGSPQGRTAWVTAPYTEGPPGAPPDYRAYGTLDPDAYKAGAAQLIGRGVPIIVHANGDAAIDLMLDGVDAAVADMNPMPDHRAVIIHAQLMRADQLDRAAALRVVPSFFIRPRLLLGRLAPAQLRRGARQQRQPGALGHRTRGPLHGAQRFADRAARHHAAGLDHGEPEDPQRARARTAPARHGTGGPARGHPRGRVPVLRGGHEGIHHRGETGRPRDPRGRPPAGGSGGAGAHRRRRDVLAGPLRVLAARPIGQTGCTRPAPPEADRSGRLASASAPGAACPAGREPGLQRSARGKGNVDERHRSR